MNPVVFLFYSDVDRILRILYDGSRPPHIQHLTPALRAGACVCSCGAIANLRVSDAQAIGWQLLPHAECPACQAQQPYAGPARDLYLELIDKLIYREEGEDVHTIIRSGVRDFHRRRDPNRCPGDCLA